GRQRAAPSSSSDEEPEPPPAPVSPPAPSPGRDSERETESEGDPGSAAASPRGSSAAAAAEEPLTPEGPAGSPGRRGEREEFFKIKKPAFNEVTFRIQKRESLSVQAAETEESKKTCQLESRTGNTKGTSEEEEEEESYSSLNEDNSSDSGNESSSLQRRKDLSLGDIPSASCIEAARRKRNLARTQADYLPLNVSGSHQVSQRRGSSDLESEDESDMKNLSFAPKMRTLRQRMTEHIGEFVPLFPVLV
ncbi:GCFC2 factor, partial [Atlantisia rogersi]|nr:GCFC2 factor [Atlantisia rogersi]